MFLIIKNETDNSFFSFLLFLYFLHPLGHIFYSISGAGGFIWNPSHGRMKWLSVGSGLQRPQQFWGRPSYNHFEVRPILTIYSPYTLNLLLPGDSNQRQHYQP